MALLDEDRERRPSDLVVIKTVIFQGLHGAFETFILWLQVKHNVRTILNAAEGRWAQPTQMHREEDCGWREHWASLMGGRAHFVLQICDSPPAKTA